MQPTDWLSKETTFTAVLLLTYRAFHPPLTNMVFVRATIRASFKAFMAISSLSVSTGHQIMPEKKLSYVRRKLLYKGHSCPA